MFSRWGLNVKTNGSKHLSVYNTENVQLFRHLGSFNIKIIHKNAVEVTIHTGYDEYFMVSLYDSANIAGTYIYIIINVETNLGAAHILDTSPNNNISIICIMNNSQAGLVVDYINYKYSPVFKAVLIDALSYYIAERINCIKIYRFDDDIYITKNGTALQYKIDSGKKTVNLQVTAPDIDIHKVRLYKHMKEINAIDLIKMQDSNRRQV